MNYLKFLYVLAILLISFNSMASQKQPTKETIPFAVYNTKADFYFLQTSKTPEYATVVNISEDEIKAIIEPLRRSLCSTLGDADVKVWLSGSIGRKLIVSASVTSGIEVTFHCKSNSG